MHDCFARLPDNRALIGDGATWWDKVALIMRVARMREALATRRDPRAPVAVLADNSPDWIAADLATQELGITLVPLPAFFTPAQWAHTVHASGAGALFCTDAAAAAALGFTIRNPWAGTLALFESDSLPPAAHAAQRPQKITFTSGTTAAPKGVCLDAAQQWAVAASFAEPLARLGVSRHLCLLPFAVLLENVAGVYTALSCGATITCPPLAEVGMRGSSGFDADVCLDAIARRRAESVILLPQMLLAILAAAGPGDERLASLRFAAVGGAKTPEEVLHAARARGIPVYEGYGLTECSSVVALNLPGAERIGSAGRPLAHRRVRVAADGEIEVGGGRFGQYLGDATPPDDWLPTGDLGRIDDDGFLYVDGRKKNVLITGFLYVDGRKKNVLITGFGRNVSPEWPESLLAGSGAIAQAVVTGDGGPHLVALLVPAAAPASADLLEAAVQRANAQLPDYARIGAWCVLPEAPSVHNGLATANGRPRRELIRARYAHLIESLYPEGA